MEVRSLYSNSSARSQELKLLEDQLAAILVTEESYQVLQIPCTNTTQSSSQRSLGEEWRRKICQWSFRVIDHFRLDREVVSFGLNIFDRFLASSSLRLAKKIKSKSPNKSSTAANKCDCPSCVQSIDSRTYQLAAMTSLYISIKLNPDNTVVTEDGVRRKRYFKLESFVDLSRGQFEADDICTMEAIILDELEWKVNPPTPMSMVAYLLTLMPPVEDVPAASKPTYDLVLHVLQELSRYITELSVCLGSLCTTSLPSQLAYAAILVSMDLLTAQALPMRTRDTFHAAVSMVSLQSGGTLLMPHKSKIRKLSQVLSKSLLPEMLLEEYDAAAVAESTTATATTTVTSTTIPATSHQSSSKSSSSSSLPSSATTESAATTAAVTASSCHPIVIARDYGLLNLARIHRVYQHDHHPQTASSSSSSNTTNNKGATIIGKNGGLESSPTGVNKLACY